MRWRLAFDGESEVRVLCRTGEEGVVFAPLYVHRFRLIAPRKLLEAQQFNRQYHSFDQIDNVPDRLRWLRHHMGWMQKEVAERIGISRAVYIDMETGGIDTCPAEVMDRLAALYQMPVEKLLDGYNLFLYYGQARQLQAYREAHALSRRQLAQQMGVCESSVRCWECGRKRMSKACWEKLARFLEDSP